MNQEEKDFHRAYGLKSGFPECCVDFWVNEYVPASDDFPRLHMAHHNYQREVELGIGKERGISYHIGYIACPNCLLKKSFVTPISCPPDTEHPKRKDHQKYLVKTNEMGYIVRISLNI